MGFFSRLFGKKDNSAELQKQREEFEAKIEAANAKLAEAEKRAADLQKSLATAGSTGAQADNSELKANYEAKLSEANAKLAEAEKRVADLERSLASVSSSGSADEALKAQLADAVAQLDQAKKAKQDAELQKDAVTAQLTDTSTKLAESEKKVAKLKKENDDLEEEIDEVNDDLKKVKKEKQEAEDQKAALEHDLKKAGEEKEKLEKAKKQVEEDCAGKENSLDFVGEILNAQEKSGDIKKVEQAVDALVDFIRHDLPSAYAEAGIKNLDDHKDPADPQSDAGLMRWATRTKKTWLNGKKSIAFVGEFSAGKTSIVNRILGSKDLLAVSAEATTAIPTYIIGGEKQSFSFVSPDDKMKALSEATFRKVSKQVLANVKGAPKLLKYFVMTSNAAGLDGISILDTPGFSSNDSEDAIRTVDVINECDALYWVFDVNNGTVNRSSIKLIKEHLHRPLFVVINKCDTKSKGDIDSVEKLISQTLKKEGVEVRQFLRFGKDADPAVLLSPLGEIEKEGDDSAIHFHLWELCGNIGWNEGRLATMSNLEKESQERVDTCVEYFKSDFTWMAETCDEIRDLVDGKWEAHEWNPFIDAKYELSRYDGQYLIDALGKLSKRANQNVEHIQDFPDVVTEASEATAAFNENKALLKILRAAQKL